MKKILDLIKNIFISASLVNLAVDIAIVAIFLIVDTLDTNAVMQLELLIGAVTFSAICGVALSVFRAIPKLLPMLRIGLEYIVCLFGLYITLFLMTGNGTNYTAFFAVATGFTVVYVLVGVCGMLIKRIYSGKGFEKKPEKEYENVFEELKK